MYLRRFDQLLLGEQSGANFDFGTDAETIYPLIARGFRGSRSDDLPMVVLCSGVSVDGGRTVKADADQIDPSIPKY